MFNPFQYHGNISVKLASIFQDDKIVNKAAALASPKQSLNATRGMFEVTDPK